jgi:quercetin dioxygenase-like cupin family protein
MLAYAAPSQRPAERVKRRLLSRIGDEGFYFLRAGESPWEPTDASGIDIRRLFIDRRDESETLLVRMAPRASHRGLPGFGPERAVVLAGQLEVDGHDLGPGDHFQAPVGTKAPERRSVAGCTLFARARARAGSGDDRAAGLRPRFAHSADRAWVEIGPGAHALLLDEDPVDAVRTAIVRMEPASDYVEHEHPGPEELVILEGDCLCQGEPLGPGDYHRAAASSRHAVTTTRGGCRMIVVTHPGGLDRRPPDPTPHGLP